MKKKLILFCLVLPPLIFFDLWTKVWADANLKNQAAIEIMNCCFHLQYAENPGAAFSILADSNELFRSIFFKAVVVVFLMVMLPVYFDMKENEKLKSFGLLLIFSGALGNFIDRLVNGYVIDFIFWHYYDKTWPIFNIADTNISIGLGLYLISVIFFEKKNQTKPA